MATRMKQYFNPYSSITLTSRVDLVSEFLRQSKNDVRLQRFQDNEATKVEVEATIATKEENRQKKHLRDD